MWQIVILKRHTISPPPTPNPGGRIARYAWGDDYHRVIKKRLFELADHLREGYPGYEYKAVVDTAPLLEREHAQRAGLGWIGKHTLLIHPRVGSWLLLGAVVTTLPITTTVSLQAKNPQPIIAAPARAALMHARPTASASISSMQLGASVI